MPTPPAARRSGIDAATREPTGIRQRLLHAALEELIRRIARRAAVGDAFARQLRPDRAVLCGPHAWVDVAALAVWGRHLTVDDDFFAMPRLHGWAVDMTGADWYGPDAVGVSCFAWEGTDLRAVAADAPVVWFPARPVPSGAHVVYEAIRARNTLDPADAAALAARLADPGT